MPLNCRSPYWLPRSIYLYAELAESRRISGTHRHQFEFLKRCAVSVPLGLTPENLVPAEECLFAPSKITAACRRNADGGSHKLIG